MDAERTAPDDGPPAAPPGPRQRAARSAPEPRRPPRGTSEESAEALAAWGLSAAQRRLYLAALRLPGFSVAELAEAAALPVERVGEQLDALEELGLVERRDGEVAAQHPGTALGRLAARRLAQATELVGHLTALQSSVGGLVDAYETGRLFESGRLPVELLHGGEELWRATMECTRQRVPSDVVAVIPDQRMLGELLVPRREELCELVSSGAWRLRALVEFRALEHETVRELLDVLVKLGGRFRLLRELPSWFVVVDRDAVGLPLAWGHSVAAHRYSSYLVRTRVIAEGMLALADDLWRRGAHPPGSGEDHDREVMRLLAQGLSDDAVARHLGVSVRTVRSRVADAMAGLDARTRLQAGVEAARRGWLR
ncbi:helix-turn-helix transcriptional regulator [Allonocardiopsis opalescens]|uniref:Sugar-specific transcriptional regulator TrmB n=1 Tax=Allonocardiopsis opalescens TaxID=1144618 RepID=A0A2T0Q875_9ACTN|nr:helix-turn-helix transcriptional regulator [Allonocardiopsis opalescens]PRY00036.1 sugar-specific transcriptional regulator TrmB [Allonocardiopsis opalescens]